MDMEVTKSFFRGWKQDENVPAFLKFCGGLFGLEFGVLEGLVVEVLCGDLCQKCIGILRFT